jgi:hypothetical protein
MRRSVLLALSLSSFFGCASVPEFPEITQHSVHADVSPPGFYGVNNKTNARTFKQFDDPSMKGAQCLSADDYRASEAWVEQVIELAKQRCQ